MESSENSVEKAFAAWVLGWTMVSLWIFFFMTFQATEKRKETLASVCDERARMLQDQFNVSMNYIQALSILISTFHHAKSPSAIDQVTISQFTTNDLTRLIEHRMGLDLVFFCLCEEIILNSNLYNPQRTFARYMERTTFKRPLTSGVAYAVRVLHSEREQFEKQQGWTIKRMDALEQNPIHEDDYAPEALEPSPVLEEYAPVIFAQETISHVISVDVLSGKVTLSFNYTYVNYISNNDSCWLVHLQGDCEKARELGKGVLTAPFRLLKTNHLGVILTFAVYNIDLPSNATPNERIQATNGYLGGIFDIESLVEKLIQQLLASKL